MYTLRSLRREVCALLLMLPCGASAQLVLLPTGPRPLAAAPRCLARASAGAPWRARIDRAAAQPDSAESLLAGLADSLATLAGTHPEDVDVQYALAAAHGARAEVLGGRARVQAAQALHAQAGRVLALDPEHPGALYLMGRLHAGVMRMDRVTRFLATRVLGGGALGASSWAEAERLLHGAMAGDPCVPEHRFELARVYAERGDSVAAVREIREMMRLKPQGPRDEMARAKAIELFAALRPDHGAGR